MIGGKPTSLLLVMAWYCFFFDGGDFDFVMGVGGALSVVDAHENLPSNLAFSLLCARPALFVSKNQSQCCRILPQRLTEHQNHIHHIINIISSDKQ